MIKPCCKVRCSALDIPHVASLVTNDSDDMSAFGKEDDYEQRCSTQLQGQQEVGQLTTWTWMPSLGSAPRTDLHKSLQLLVAVNDIRIR